MLPRGASSPHFYTYFILTVAVAPTQTETLKFANDSVIVSLLNNEEVSHGPVINDFVAWCDNVFLQLNITKTKDMLIDFRSEPPVPLATAIKGQSVEMVSYYKYLGTVIDNHLKFDANTEMLCKKGQQRLFCLRKLAKFQVDKSLMSLFYRSYI